MAKITLLVRRINGVERFICRCGFPDNPIPRKAGFSFNYKAPMPEDRYWYTDDIMIAARLRFYADGELRQRLMQVGAKPKQPTVLTRQGEWFVFRSEKEHRNLAKDAGFTFDKQGSFWWTTDADHAALLAQFADSSCRDHLQALLRQLQEAKAASRAIDAAIEIPRPANLKDNYLPYQRGAVAFAARVLNLDAKGGDAHPSRGMLYADEMG